MFVRKKQNKSGSISVQIIEKSNGINKLIKTIGCSKDKFRVEHLYQEGLRYISERQGQSRLDLFEEDNAVWFAEVFSSIKNVKLIGPELILGKLFDQIGFNSVGDELFRHLVLSRIINPSSKLKTVRDLKTFYGVDYSVDVIYRYMDNIVNTLKDQIEQISYEHTLSLFGGVMSMVFYDVTTIYFEAEKEDELRVTGFSKEGKHKHPQVLLGLLVSLDGYPLGYDIFPGNTYEGHTMLPVLKSFSSKFGIKKLVIVADSGLLTNSNIEQLSKAGYSFILGARIKSEPKAVKNQITSLTLKDGEYQIIRKQGKQKLIVHYSEKRAKKDKFNRERGLKRLESALKKGKLTKSHINNRGYNKYLQMEGDVAITIDYEKFETDQKWDGLKGYLTNTNHDPKTIIANYAELWKIEKAFRVSKTDLKVRPIFHRIQSRIEAHICISFTAYKIYKELERLLKLKQSNITVNRAIEIIKTTQQITLVHPRSKKTKTQILIHNKDQKELLKLFEINHG